MNLDDKNCRRRECIFQALHDALAEMEYPDLTIEEIAARAKVGKSTIYRWWQHKADLVMDVFRESTMSIFDLDFEQGLEQNLNQQLGRLAEVLHQPIGRAMLVVIANHREQAARFFSQYLLPRREQMRVLIQQVVQRQEIRDGYDYDLMLDTLYAPIHYQIIFFNNLPDAAYIQRLVQLALAPVRL